MDSASRCADRPRKLLRRLGPVVCRSLSGRVPAGNGTGARRGYSLGAAAGGLLSGYIPIFGLASCFYRPDRSSLFTTDAGGLVRLFHAWAGAPAIAFCRQGLLPGVLRRQCGKRSRSKRDRDLLAAVLSAGSFGPAHRPLAFRTCPGAEPRPFSRCFPGRRPARPAWYCGTPSERAGRHCLSCGVLTQCLLQRSVRLACPIPPVRFWGQCIPGLPAGMPGRPPAASVD